MDKKKLEELSEQEIEQLRARVIESIQGAKAKAEEAKAKGGRNAQMEAGMAFIEAMTDALDKLGLVTEGDSKAGLDRKPAPDREERKAVLDLPDETTLCDGPVEVLVERYADIASAAQDAMEHGRVTRHNRLSDRVRKIAKALAARTPDGRKALLPLLSHPDAGVREFAAHDCRDLIP